MNGLYEPEKEKQRVQEIREMKRAVRHEKARQRKEKREKYKTMYKEELAKQRAKLQAQKEKEIEVFRSQQAISKAKRQAMRKVKPFTPKKGFKMPSKVRLQKAGQEALKTGKTVFEVLQKMERMYAGKPTPRKRKVTRKTPKRKVTKKTPKRKVTRKTPKRKGKSYYCRKCHKRHSYSSKIGRKHR